MCWQAGVSRLRIANCRLLISSDEGDFARSRKFQHTVNFSASTWKFLFIDTTHIMAPSLRNRQKKGEEAVESNPHTVDSIVSRVRRYSQKISEPHAFQREGQV